MQLRSETYALYLACRDPRVPWYARLWVALVVGYALCPIDLIPDFIPVLGQLDDVILVPVGLFLALRMIPAQVMAESRVKAAELLAQGDTVSRTAAAFVVVTWLLLAVLSFMLVWQAIGR
jgi:uncharacterized membrane protein YkvA (DUF1232 family)